MNNFPLVSALCCTYGRQHLLIETIQSFLYQTYPNKELIIINDEPGVNLKLNYPMDNIKILNYSTRFKSLGAKREEGKIFCSGKYLLLWEDDDLSFPWRIEDSVRYMEENVHLDGFTTIHNVYFNGNNYASVCANNFESSACYKTEFIKLNNYNHESSLLMDLQMHNLGTINRHESAPYFMIIYRFNNPGTFHLSAQGEDPIFWEQAASYTTSDQHNGLLNPEFSKNYYKETVKGILDNPPDYFRNNPDQINKLIKRLEPWL